MNTDGFIILLPVIIGLVPICQSGRWNWKVVKAYSSLNAFFWFGWFSILFVGILTIFGFLRTS